MIKKMKNEEGAALVLAMMVLLVLSILGAMLGTLTVGSHRLSANNQDYNSAYYIAEAGANMAYEEIKEAVNTAYDNNDSSNFFFDEVDEISIIDDGKEYYKKENGEYVFDSQSGSHPKAIIDVEIIESGSNSEKEYVIKSIGEVAGRTRTVEKPFRIKWVSKNNKDDKTNDVFNIPNNASIVAKDKLHYLGGEIHDDIYLYSLDSASFETSTDVWFKPNKIYTSYPDSKTKENVFYGSGGGIQRIFNFLNERTETISPRENKSSSYLSYFNEVKQSPNITTENKDLKFSQKKNKITLENDLKVSNLILGGLNTINVNDNHITLIVDNINSFEWVRLKIEGSGSLTIIVNDTATFNGLYNFDWGPYKSGNLRIIFPHENDVINIVGDGTHIGAQIIAPFSHIKIGRNPNIYGTVLAKEVTMENNHPIVKYIKMEFDNSHFNNSNISHDLNQLIEAQPSLEQ